MAQAARRLGRGRRDGLRRHHRQGRRRDPVAGRRPPRADPGRAGRDGRGRDADRRDRRRGTPGRGAPRRAQRQTTAGRRAARLLRSRAGGGGRRSLGLLLARRPADRRQARHRPRSGRGHRDRRPGAQEGRARLHRGSRRRRPRPEPVLHTESPYRPEEVEAPQSSEAGDEAAPAASAGAPPPTVDELSGPRGRADVADAPGDRPAHGREPAHRGALHDDRRGRHVRGSRRGAPS